GLGRFPTAQGEAKADARKVVRIAEIKIFRAAAPRLPPMQGQSPRWRRKSGGNVCLLSICGRPLPGKGKRWDRCCAWADAVICPAFYGEGRHPPAYMGVRGLGPDHPKRAQSTVESPGLSQPRLADCCAILSFRSPLRLRDRGQPTPPRPEFCRCRL